jgi:hypothetical protein
LSTPASRQGLEYLFSPLTQASDPLKAPLRTELGWHKKGPWGLSQPGRAPMDNRPKTLKGSGGVEHIGLTVTDTDKVGLGTVFMDSNHRLQTLESLVAFLRFDGAAFAGGSATYPSRVTGPDPLRNQAQGHPLRSQCQRGAGQQPVLLIKRVLSYGALESVKNRIS